MHSFRLVSLLAAAMLAWAPRPAHAGVIQDGAVYLFNGDLTSLIPTAADLSNIGPGTNTFATETVFGNSESVLAFPYNNGVALGYVSTAIPSDTYTIEIEFRFAELSGYRRVIDWKAGTSDCGLYLLNGALNMYCTGAGAVTPIAPNQWVRLVVTRTAGGKLDFYLDGDLLISQDDSSAKNGVIQDNTLRFFRDNECVAACGEAASGQAASIILDPKVSDAATIAGNERCGDANGSHQVNAADALLALKAALGSAWCSKTRCDVIKDGSIKAADALRILRAAIGVNPLPVVCEDIS